MSKIKELWELRAFAKTVLETVPLIQGVENAGNTVLVILDDGAQEDEIDEQLRDNGAVITVLPLVMGKVRDQSGPATIIDCDVVVMAAVNPETNPDGVNIDLAELVSDIIKTMTNYPRKPGGEFFQVGKEAVFALDDAKERLLSYKIFFTKEVTP